MDARVSECRGVKFVTCHFNVPRLVETMRLLGEFSSTQDNGNIERFVISSILRTSSEGPLYSEMRAILVWT
jgi:hypothetical protein